MKTGVPDSESPFSLKKMRSLSRRQLHKRDVAVLFGQLSVMLNAGLTLVRSLNILKVQADRPSLEDVLTGIVENLEKGMSFEQALAVSRGRFPILAVYLIRAGETAGILADVLVRLSDYLEDEDQMAAKMFTTLIYPVIVLVFALMSIVFIASYIMPIFSELYATAGVPLPWLTRGMMILGQVLQDRPLEIGALMMMILLGARYAAGLQRGRLCLDRNILRIPLIGRICIDMEVMRFTQIMAALLEAGVILSEALETAAGVLGNSYLRGIMREIHSRVINGDALASALSNHSIFPPLMVQMIAVGEESGALAFLFNELSRHTRRDLVNRVDRLMAALEPVLVLLVALVVGSVVLATLIPVYSIISVTTGM